MKRQLAWFGLVAGAVLLGALQSRAQPVSHAATASSLSLVSLDDDRFYNYDFTSQTVAQNGVDWPVGLLFWNNADINKVKSGLNSAFRYGGSTMYSQLDDGAGLGWDGDGGRKSSYCPFFGQATHYRIYADGDDRLYNLSWGFYVLGTAHYDTRECGFNAWFGRSEDAEAAVAAKARQRWGSGNVAEDALPLYNAEPYRQEGNHIWQNDGNATTVSVP